MKKQDKTVPVKDNAVNTVLQGYLDELLINATRRKARAAVAEKPVETPVAEKTAEPEVNVSVQRVEKTLNVDALAVPVTTPVTDTDELVAVETEVEVVPVVQETIQELSQEELQDISVELTSVSEDVQLQPEAVLTDEELWQEQGVECLLFSVAGLKLAVPLPLLGSVHELEEDQELTPLFGQPSWYLGMLNTEQGHVQVIDTASFIMPEREASLKEQGFRYLIQLDRSPWVMACQSIDDTVRLDASEIKWRGDRSKRPWLAGTVIDKMCALLDVSGLLELVETSCKPS